MNVTFNGLVATFTASGGLLTTVALLPAGPGGTVVFVTPKIHQFFRLYKQATSWDELPSVFPTKESVRTAAEHYAEGHTNKDRFVASAANLVRGRKITELDFQRLREFINKCDCAPSVIRKKLGVMGYGALPLEFEDVDPRLEWSVDTMWDFVQYLGTRMSNGSI